MSVVTKKHRLTHTPNYNYIRLFPPGEELSEKMKELGIDIDEMAQSSRLPVETIRQILNVEIALTPELAKHLERATLIPVGYWMRCEENYRERLLYAKEHPELTVIRRSI
jgi:plasmid maintenance system antidote protein VapI